ncbi:MAG: MGMT family protein [Chitinophagales bacterium]|nr:MGMT family protein [Chitinophagales bacterium]
MKEDNFYERVYAVVRKIPRGRVTNYGAIADYIGTGMSARMVGWAMHGGQAILPKVPAHRVVNRNGLLTGKHHFSTPTLMMELLEAEGISVENNQVTHFRKLFWDPFLELNSRSNKKSGLSKKKRK